MDTQIGEDSPGLMPITTVIDIGGMHLYLHIVLDMIHVIVDLIANRNGQRWLMRVEIHIYVGVVAWRVETLISQTNGKSVLGVYCVPSWHDGISPKSNWSTGSRRWVSRRPRRPSATS